MKKLNILCCSLLFSFALQAQPGLNTGKSLSDASVVADVKSSAKELIVPKMTITQRNALSSPAAGLRVFCTDNNQIYTNIGTPENPNWKLTRHQLTTTGSEIFESWHKYSENSSQANGC
jgi:trimeric autotransporter adhesin